jgi:hypothetical protein
MRYVGIDPGLAGGLAVLELGSDGARRAVALTRTPVAIVHRRGGAEVREYDVPAMLFELLAACGSGPCAIVLERLGPRPPARGGGQGRGTVSAFRSGVGVGLWHALAVTTNRPVHFVTPMAWKRHHGLLGTDKVASRLRAAERFPELGRLRAVDEGPAEALLMAAWLAAHDAGVTEEQLRAHA